MVRNYHTFKTKIITLCFAGLLAAIIASQPALALENPATGKGGKNTGAPDKNANCAPEVTDWAPKIEETKTRLPTITATIQSKCGVDIDISTIKMVVDNETVYPKVSGSGSSVTLAFVPYLGLMEECYVTVSAQDANGQTVEKDWMFEVPYWVQEMW